MSIVSVIWVLHLFDVGPSFESTGERGSDCQSSLRSHCTQLGREGRLEGKERYGGRIRRRPAHPFSVLDRQSREFKAPPRRGKGQGGALKKGHTMQAFASLIGFLLLAATPALAQTTTAPTTTGGDIPWVWIILAIIVIGGGIWWYMSRMRGPRI
jgi:hypothetical protein